MILFSQIKDRLLLDNKKNMACLWNLPSPLNVEIRFSPSRSQKEHSNL